MNKDMANMVIATGFGGKGDVLFSSPGVRALQWYDSDGELMAMLLRINNKLWGLSLRGDDDWDEMVKLYGSKPKEE